MAPWRQPEPFDGLQEAARAVNGDSLRAQELAERLEPLAARWREE